VTPAASSTLEILTDPLTIVGIVLINEGRCKAQVNRARHPFLGSTSLLIGVGVAVDTIRQLEAPLPSRHTRASIDRQVGESSSRRMYESRRRIPSCGVG
jgi:hypothetical protein